MKGFGFIVFGVLLIGLAALWFLTPVSELIMSKTMTQAPNSPVPGGEYATRSPGGTVKSVLNWAEMLIDGLNVAFGAAGLYFTIKGWRLRSQDNKSSENEA